MYQQFYRASEWLSLPLAVTLLFIAVFVGVVVWAYGSRRGRQGFEPESMLPLGEEHYAVEARGAREHGRTR